MSDPQPEMTTLAARRIIDPLLEWHNPDARRLPFRDSADAFGVLVSEIMAQQTQAERAASAWKAFMQQFPTAAALAVAPTSDVIDAWRGLGYNRRAVNLQRAAAVIVTEHAGEVPSTLEGLLALPGVGPYTARAVLAFAFGVPIIPVDTNVARVLSRVSNTVLSRARAQILADDLSHTRRKPGGSLPAALMDLGATTCTARSPSCGECPLIDNCLWAGSRGLDPAARGAHRPTPQGSFEGSARQARGRIVDALRAGPIDHATALGLAGAHGLTLISGLVRDGLADTITDGLALPGWSGNPEQE